MRYIAYIGTYAKNGGEGIYRISVEEGSLALLGATPAANASYLAYANGALYAAIETKDGGAAAFRADKDGALTLLGGTPVYGDAPCHLCVDGGRVYVANYMSGSLSLAELRTDGGISGDVQVVRYAGKGPNAARQEAPHAHFAALTPDGAYLAVCDLGTDKIRFYPHAASGVVLPGDAVDAPAGVGPRHAAFGPDGVWYCVCEMTCEVLVYRGYGRRAALLQRVSALAAADASASAAAIRLSPDGGRLLVSVRGPNTLALFAVRADGTLEPGRLFGAHGCWPRDAAFTPDGRYVLCACERDNRLTAFSIAPDGLVFVGELAIPSPVCVCFME